MEEFKEGSPMYVVLLKCDKEIFIQCGNNGAIICFPTEKRALSFWENGYKSAFSRGLCGATGAMIALIQYNPKVVFFNNQTEMVEVLFNDLLLKKMSSGSISGILCQKDANGVYDNGKEPELLERR